MVDYKYKYNGVEGQLSVVDPDAIQRLQNYWNVAEPIYLIDELILMLFAGRDKVLSVELSPELLKTPEFLATVNNLSDVYISINNQAFRSIT